MDIDNLEIILGTYEEFVVGFKVVQLESQEYTLVQSFANHAHNASVRSVAASTIFMASGSSDETIRLYDMKDRKETGLLMHHHGNVNCLEFTPSGSHLVSGCENGSIGICRTGSWQLEKLWTAAHKGTAVSSFSVHPTGKMLLSVGADGAIRTWNLIKGRPAFTTHLCKPKEGRSVTQVLWSPGGEFYAVAIASRVEIFTVAKAAVSHTIEVGKKVTFISFTSDDVLCIGTEEGQVLLHDATTGVAIGETKAYANGRVRCLAAYGTDWLVTASSEGHIKLWWRKDRSSLTEVCSTKIGARVTCMAAISSAPAEDLLLLKAKAAAAKQMPVATKPPPRAGSAYVVIETAEETENFAREAKQAKKKVTKGLCGDKKKVSDNEEKDSEDEENVSEEEMGGDVEEEELTDEDSVGEIESAEGEEDEDEDENDRLAHLLNSDTSSDSDEEGTLTNSKNGKRKAQIQGVKSKFVEKVSSKKQKVAKEVLEKTNSAQRSVKKQNTKSSPNLKMYPSMRRISKKAAKKLLETSSSGAWKTE